jgi:hypothetical protein
MRRKKAIPIVCLWLLLFLPGLCKAEKFSLKLSGGMNYLSMGDINTGIKGISDEWSAFAASQGGYVQGEAKPLHFSYDLEGTIIIDLTPKIGIGFGIGYIEGTRTSEITFSGSFKGSLTNKLKIRAIPFRLGVFYTLPMRERINVVFNAGVGVYLAQCDYDRLPLSADLIGPWVVHLESSSEGFGFHGGVGFEFKIASNLSFVFEGQGRYVKIGGFGGTNSGMIRPFGGTLYYYEETTATGTYPMIDIFENKPSYPNSREAKVDFSGITFLAGIKINL